MNCTQIRPKTIKLISRLVKPLVDEGIILVSEEQEIFRNLKHLVEKGALTPAIKPKLIDQAAAAEILGIGLSNFKKLEKSGAFTFNRRMVGSAVRYRNVDVFNFVMAADE